MFSRKNRQTVFMIDVPIFSKLPSFANDDNRKLQERVMDQFTELMSLKEQNLDLQTRTGA